MRREFLALLLLAWGCEAGTIPLIPDAEPDTNWAPYLQGTTQRGPVQGHMIVFAYDGLDPLPGMQVVLQYADGQRVDALTNDIGRADFYEPDLYGPMDLHFLHDDYYRRSWIGVDAQIVTVPMRRVRPLIVGSVGDRGEAPTQRVTIRGMDQLPASDAERVRFAFVAKGVLDRVPNSRTVFEQVPGPELISNIDYWPGYRLELAAVGGVTNRSDSAGLAIPWQDITRIGVGNNPDPEEPQVIELTHALDQEFEFEFQESPQLIDDGLMDEWDAAVHVSQFDFAWILIPAVHGGGVTRMAKVPRPNGSFSGSTYTPWLQGKSAGGRFAPQLIGAGPNKRRVGRIVLPRSHVQLLGRTLELSPPPRPVDLSVVSLIGEYVNEYLYETEWEIHMFEHRDQVVLPVDAGRPSFTLRVLDFGLSEFDPGNFSGHTELQCSAETQDR